MLVLLNLLLVCWFLLKLLASFIKYYPIFYGLILYAIRFNHIKIISFIVSSSHLNTFFLFIVEYKLEVQLHLLSVTNLIFSVFLTSFLLFDRQFEYLKNYFGFQIGLLINIFLSFQIV